MGDECNVRSCDYIHVKDHNKGNLYVKSSKELSIETITSPPEYSIQCPIGDTNLDNQRVTFPYISTKLRAEAPPFTPDYTTLSKENSAYTLDLIPTNSEYEDHCFVNVNLVNDDLIHAPDKEICPIVKETIRDKNLKLLDETPVQSFNPILPDIEIAMNPIYVAPESSPSVAIKEEIVLNQCPVHSRIFFRRFNFGNTTKIAFLIASIVISLILIIYIFV